MMQIGGSVRGYGTWPIALREDRFAPPAISDCRIFARTVRRFDAVANTPFPCSAAWGCREGDRGSRQLAYTTAVNVVFLLLAALLVLFFSSGGAPVVKVMVGSPDVPEHARGGVTAVLTEIGTGRRHDGPPAGGRVSPRGRCRARRVLSPSDGRACRRGSPCAVRRRYGYSTRTGRAAGWRSPRCSRCRL